MISLQDGDLELAKQGRVTFSVQSGLHHWSYMPSSPILVNVNASQLSLVEVARAANSNAPRQRNLSAAARRAISERMTRYWAARRKAKAKAQGKK